MNLVRLISPTVELSEQYFKFYYDWINSGEDIIPWVVERDPSSFQHFVAFLYSADSEGKLSNPNLVPHSTYLLMNEQSLIVGAVNIRHRLNEKLLNSDGHIGYGICPSQRRKGYATILLQESLQVAKSLGISRVLLVCNQENIGSEKTILKNGGVFDSEFQEEDGRTVKRFWITVS
ncbi:GNAT family N-acetyltransferase [Paenibacillaceae bacterium]|nr:GNAT family N-acetyltransferase [Paenibacillaceae bacterium]